MDTDLIKREHLEHLNLLSNSFYEFAFLDNVSGDDRGVVLRGNIGPVVVTYYPLVDHLTFVISGSICIVEDALYGGMNVYDKGEVTRELQRLLVEGEWS